MKKVLTLDEALHRIAELEKDTGEEIPSDDETFDLVVTRFVDDYMQLKKDVARERKALTAEKCHGII